MLRSKLGEERRGLRFGLVFDDVTIVFCAAGAVTAVEEGRRCPKAVSRVRLA